MSEETTNPVAEEVTGVEQAVENQTAELEAEGQEGDEPEGEQPAPEDDSEEIDWEDGQKYRVPKALKPALMKQADYTRKTQEVAEAKRALAEREQSLIQQAEARTALAAEQAHVLMLKGQVDEFKKVDWNTLAAQDPTYAQSAMIQYQALRDQLTDAERDFGMKLQQRALEEQQTTAKQFQEGYAKLPSVVKGWSTETENKIAAFALNAGVTQSDLREAIAKTPERIELLRLAMVGAEAEKQQTQAKKQLQAQKTEPAKTVRGASGRFAPAPDTTDFAAFEKWADQKLKKV